jgi:hypothetical protein
MNAGGPIIFEHGRQARGNLSAGNAVSVEYRKFKGRQCIVAETRFWDSDDFSRTIGQALTYFTLPSPGAVIAAR